MRIQNVSSDTIIFGDLRIPSTGIAQSSIPPGEIVTVYNEDAQRSFQLGVLIDGGQIVNLGPDEPDGGTPIAQSTFTGSNSVSVSGVPSSGQVLTATGPNAANWASGGGGGGTPGGVAGNIQFNDGSSFAGSNNLYWDADNNRLGVGLSSPTGLLSVNASHHSTGTPSFIITQSEYGDTIFSIQSKGRAHLQNYDNYSGAGPALLLDQWGSNAGPGLTVNQHGNGGPVLVLNQSNSAQPALITTGSNTSIGIGTASPASNAGLDVEIGSILVNASGGGSFTSGLSLSNESTYLQIQSWNNTPLSINPLGNNVGIGTVSPIVKLDVTGDINFTNTILFNGSTVLNTNNNNILLGLIPGSGGAGGNVCIGGAAGVALNSGSDNTYVGFDAAISATNGSGNVVIGYNSGSGLITGSNNVFIGPNSANGIPGDPSGILCIANTSTNPPLIYGDFSAGFIGLGTITPAHRLDVVGDVNITGIYRIGGSQISSSDLSDHSSLLTGSGTNTGSGWHLPIWTSSSVLGNSLLADDGTSVANTGYYNMSTTTNPAGSACAIGSDGGGGLILSIGGSTNQIFFRQSGFNAMVVGGGGGNPGPYVGIVKSNPAYRLDVGGDVNSDTLYRVAGSAGASGTFTTSDSKTVTVSGGIITSIV